VNCIGEYQPCTAMKQIKQAKNPVPMMHKRVAPLKLLERGTVHAVNKMRLHQAFSIRIPQPTSTHTKSSLAVITYWETDKENPWKKASLEPNLVVLVPSTRARLGLLEGYIRLERQLESIHTICLQPTAAD